tara:strand:+ start:270 stop:485 length:216 start_codon:yes stop_codon:yes gene_type:complete
MEKKKINNNIQIEDAFNQLSSIVDEIEQSDISLEKTIKLFEEGMNLVKICQDKLEMAEEKVRLILNKKNND